MKVKCPFCKEEVFIPESEILEGLNVTQCPHCKEGIVWNNLKDN